jgi:hypothetical protein
VPLAKPEGLASARASFAWPVAPYPNSTFDIKIV